VARDMDRANPLAPINEMGRRFRDNGRLVKYDTNPKSRHRLGTWQKVVSGTQRELYWKKLEDIFGTDFEPDGSTEKDI
jgi:hypothetical protein